MRVVLSWFLAVVAVGSLADAQVRNPTTAPCAFSIQEAAVSVPTFVGDQDLTGRFKRVPQADSPVQIVEVDLSKFHVLVAGSSFQHEKGEYAVLLRNRSDTPVTNVRGSLNIMIGSPAASTGLGWIWTGTLMPGETARVVRRSGAGAGTTSEGDVFLTATVDSVTVGGCTYLPSGNSLRR